MTEQKINMSDYTDRKGVVHSSIGENIRSDNNGLFIDNFLDSYYELSADERLNFPFFPFKKGKWTVVTDTITNGKHTSDLYFVKGDENGLVLNEKITYAIIIDNEMSTENGLIRYFPSKINYNKKPCFFIGFNGAVSASDNGKKLKLMCYVED